MIYNSPVRKKPRKLGDNKKEPRFSIVRNVSRRTGEASWGIYDNRPFDPKSPVIFVGDNLKTTILELERLNQPPERLRYTRHGQVGFINPDEEIEDIEESSRID